jgi:hypothetical protein
MATTMQSSTIGKTYTVTVTTTSGRVFVAGPFATVQKARKEQKRWACGTWVASATVAEAEGTVAA